MNFAKVLDLIDRRLKADGHSFALIGGLGLAALGIPRATLDLDLLVPAEAQDTLIALMEELDYETLHRSSGYSNHVHQDEQFGRVDFVYVRGDTQTAVFEGAREIEGPGGRAVLVPRPEHLAAMKILALKNDPQRRLQDLADIAAISRLPGVDRAEIESQFERHGMLALWHELGR